MLTSDPVFVGTRNYRDLMDSREFIQSFLNMFKYVVIILPSTMILGFLLALLMNMPIKLKGFYRTVFFSPNITSMVAVSAVWMFIYHPQYGVFNGILRYFELPAVRWLNDPDTALFSVSVISIWRMLGFTSVVYLGGLTNISGEIIEAARIDGVGRLQMTLRIRIPLVSSTSFMLLLLLTIDSLKMFTAIDIMTGGGPANSTKNLAVMMIRYAFREYRMGYACAIAVVLFLTIFLVNIIQMQFERAVFYD